ncbi:hypothetical protein [Ammoniphilus sp. 3BR4]|uniref:hypothetical protein n=1 Tax=Ammoniphilus sp. 3BR4 TaxID=3158265 RepID=UPI0034650B13
MKEKMMRDLNELIEQWDRNQKTSIMEGAEDEATFLEHKFYVFIDSFKAWYETLDGFASLDQALAYPDIEHIAERLPAPLYLPFENELDLLVDGITQENDEKYD